MKRILTLLLLLSAVSMAQVKLEGPPEPKLVNAKLQSLSASSGLGATIENFVHQHTQPAWVGYAVPTQNRSRLICCFDQWNNDRLGCCTGCKLEGSNHGNYDSTGGTCVRSDPPTHIFVLIRIEGGAVTKVRPYTPDCGLDAGGLDFIWLHDVKPAESVAWLEKQVTQDEPRGYDGPLQSLALHSDPAADNALERLMQPSATPTSVSRKIREQAAFWVAQTRGHKGFLQLQKLAQNDSDDRFREQLTFDFSQSDDPQAVQELVRMARHDESKRVRGQAIFWLAQKAGKIAVAAINDALENDPDNDIKKKAVFALSQLPRDEGVPLLIKYAGSGRNPVVRKEAIFWLGQSGDPRALDFLENLVTGTKQ